MMKFLSFSISSILILNYIYCLIYFGDLVIAANILALVRLPGHIITITDKIIEIFVNCLYLVLYYMLFLFCVN